MIRKILILIFLSYGNMAEAWYYRGGDLTFSVIGTSVNFNLVLYLEGPGFITDSLDIDNGTGSETWVYLNSDTIINGIHKTVYTGSQQYPGPGTYVITAFFANRVQGICNIPGSVNEPMCLRASLVLSPFFSYTSSPLFVNNHFNKTMVSDTVIHDTGAYDPEGDSLSFELVECAGENCDAIGGYAFPSQFPGFENLDTNGILKYLISIQCKMQFAIKVTKWRMGVELCSAYRDILLENYWVGVNEINPISQLNVFPNPAMENIVLQLEAKLNFEDKIEIYSITGDLVFSQTHSFVSGENEININIGDFSSGIYWVGLGNEGKGIKFCKN